MRLKDSETGEFVHPTIHTRKELIKQIGQYIPRLKSQIRAAQAQRQAQQQAAQPAKSNTTVRKKKGKKGRRRR